MLCIAHWGGLGQCWALLWAGDRGRRLCVKVTPISPFKASPNIHYFLCKTSLSPCWTGICSSYTFKSVGILYSIADFLNGGLVHFTVVYLLWLIHEIIEFKNNHWKHVFFHKSPCRWLDLSLKIVTSCSIPLCWNTILR